MNDHSLYQAKCLQKKTGLLNALKTFLGLISTTHVSVLSQDAKFNVVRITPQYFPFYRNAAVSFY